jgi:DNA-binding NarL/FixJ family response regulator
MAKDGERYRDFDDKMVAVKATDRSKPMKKIRVLLADDHTILRQGIRVMMEAEPDISVVGEASDGRQAVQLTIKLRPDVAVIDLAMPLLNGLEATRQITKQNPSAKVLMLSSYGDNEYVHQVTKAGAAGYLLKHTVVDDLINAIREVAKGNAYFSPSVCRGLVENYRDTAKDGGRGTKRRDALTIREAEVLQLIAEGQPNKRIAAELGISIKTVEKHRQQVMYKLNIHDIAGLTRYAISRGVIESGVMQPLTPASNTGSSANSQPG